MKKLVSIIFLSFSTVGFSQNYSGQYAGSIHFYSIIGNNEIYSIREDTNYVSGGELIRIPELLRRNVQAENIIDPNCMFLNSTSCVYKSDSSTLIGKKIFSGNNKIRYINHFDDSVVIRFNIPIGDTQTVFRDINQKIIFKTVTKESGILFGQNDSLIKFLVLHEDISGNTIPSNINEDTVVFSKNCGMIQGFSMDDFPNTFKEIILEGIRNPNYGFDGLSYSEIYNFQINDEYETEMFQMPFKFLYYRKILLKTDLGSVIQYSVEKRVYNYQWNPNITSFELTNADTSIVNESYSKLNYIDNVSATNKRYFKNSQPINSCSSGISYEHNDYLSCLRYCPTSDCLGYPDCSGSDYFLEKFQENTGKLYGDYTNPDLTHAYFNLNYSNFQNNHCGSSEILSINSLKKNNAIHIYPNPTHNYINIEFYNFNSDYDVYLMDITGKIVIHGQNVSRIDVSEITNGIYFICIPQFNTVEKLQILK